MKNLANSYLKYTDHLEQINRAVEENPLRLVSLIERSFRKSVALIADEIVANIATCRCMMLAGPSSSGKTTTSKLLIGMLLRRGIRAVPVEMDRFYLGEGKAPVLENGKYDYESVHALDLEKMIACLKEMMLTGQSEMPVFDFVARCPAHETQVVALQPNEIAIIEGIHALNPLITEHLPAEALLKMYISVKQGIKNLSVDVLSSRDIRLIRRLVRDYNFRNCTPERTMSMWAEICRGEDVYITPYKRLADYTINSIHIYEPCVFFHLAIPLLKRFGEDSPYYDLAQHLIEGLQCFTPMDPQLVPKDSLLREFYGGGIYE